MNEMGCTLALSFKAFKGLSSIGIGYPGLFNVTDSRAESQSRLEESRQEEGWMAESERNFHLCHLGLHCGWLALAS